MQISVPDIYPLRTIWEEHLQEECTYEQLKRWAESNRSSSFPTPERKMGKYNLYDVSEVVEWVILWKRISANLGRGEELNASRNGS